MQSTNRSPGYKKALLAWITILLAIPVFAFPPPTAAMSGNLAEGRTASTDYAGSWWHNIVNATDGDDNTIAQPTADVLWDLTVDLGSVRNIDRVRFVPDSVNYAAKYTVEVSADQVNWTRVALEEWGDGQAKTYDFGVRSARYVKIAVQEKSNYGHAVKELEVYNTGNMALGKTVTTSYAGGWWHAIGNAVDGDASTFAQPDSDVLWSPVVDLGGVTEVGQVAFTPDSVNYASQYTIQVSTDNASWTTVATETAGAGQSATYDFAPTSARYVKVAVTARGNFGHAVREIEVYGAATPNVAAGSTVTTDYAGGWWHAIGNAVDGDPGTIAQPSGDALWDLTLDLGALKSLNRVVFTPDSVNYARKYTILVSPDNVDWTAVAAETNGQGQRKAYDFARRSLRSRTGSGPSWCIR